MLREYSISKANFVNGDLSKIFNTNQIQQVEKEKSQDIREYLNNNSILRRLFNKESNQNNFISQEITENVIHVFSETIKSKSITKTRNELLTYNSLIELFNREKIINKIIKKEDNMFIKTINDICDNKNISTGFNDAFQYGLNELGNIPYCKILMNNTTFLSFSFNTENIRVVGTNNEQLSCDIFINNMRYTIIKTYNKIVANNVIYFFAPQECFCQFSMQQDATLSLEQSGDKVTSFIYERPVCNIVNPWGVVKVTLS